ncbi:helix-turn-helix domain-containing protein [Demequina aurantiaca]|uniref:helix-turn-helix domain-containing protein n=1 Tax=Demequina aurantiaca TaxID=676200 RepID=UPI003D3457A0
MGLYPHLEASMPSLPVRKPADLAAVIRAAREDAGLSQVELADRLAFSRDYMIDLESAKSNLYVTRLFRTLHELGVTLTLEYGDDDVRA